MSFEAGLLTILVRLRAIATEDAEAIKKSFHDSDVDQFDDFLLEEGLVDEENLLQALSEYYQVPSFEALGYFFERHYVHMFPKEMLIRNRIIPLEVEGNIMIIVASNPQNPELLPEIGEHVSYDIQFYVGVGRDICDAAAEFYDKADTESSDDSNGEDIEQERLLAGEFQLLEDGEEISFVLDNEDTFE